MRYVLAVFSVLIVALVVGTSCAYAHTRVDLETPNGFMNAKAVGVTEDADYVVGYAYNSVMFAYDARPVVWDFAGNVVSIGPQMPQRGVRAVILSGNDNITVMPEEGEPYGPYTWNWVSGQTTAIPGVPADAYFMGARWGTLVGKLSNASGSAVMITWDGKTVPLKGFGDKGGEYALDVNACLEAVGAAVDINGIFHGVRWDSNGNLMNDFGSGFAPWSTNDMGWVVGTSYPDENSCYASYWDMIEVKQIPGVSANSFSEDINLFGQIVGNDSFPDPENPYDIWRTRPFLYDTEDGSMEWLEGAFGDTCTAINNRGYIVGEHFDTAQSTTGGVLWAVPEAPASYLMLLGLLGTFAFRRRK